MPEASGERIAPSGELESTAQPCELVRRLCSERRAEGVAYLIESLSESDNLLVCIGGGVEEGSMANIVPEPEDIVTEVLLHEGLKLDAIDVLVHVAMEDEVGKGRAGLHQGGLVLGVGDRPNTNVWVLARDGAHPRVLRCLVEFISESNARLGELLRGGTKIGERRIEQLGNEVQDVRGGDLRVHVAVGEGTHEDNTPDQVGTVVCRDVGGDDTAHGPITGVIQCVKRSIEGFPHQPAKIGLFFPIPKWSMTALKSSAWGLET